jgi:thiol-disulfide isomerase/thioredoxin
MSDLDLRRRLRRSRISGKAASAGIGLLAMLGLMAWGMLNQEPRTGRSGITRVGKPAPDFTLGVLGTDEMLSLSDYSGTPTVLNVWASWCPPCRVELPLLERGWNEYRDQGV